MKRRGNQWGVGGEVAVVVVVVVNTRENTGKIVHDDTVCLHWLLLLLPPIFIPSASSCPSVSSNFSSLIANFLLLLTVNCVCRSTPVLSSLPLWKELVREGKRKRERVSESEVKFKRKKNDKLALSRENKLSLLLLPPPRTTELN